LQQIFATEWGGKREGLLQNMRKSRENRIVTDVDHDRGLLRLEECFQWNAGMSEYENNGREA
jgi:hypothetical protein